MAKTPAATLDQETGHITLADGTVLRPADIIDTLPRGAAMPSGYITPATMADVTIGQRAYVSGTGQLRRGYVVKIGRTSVTVRYTTPSNPTSWFDKTQPLGAIAVSAPPAPQADPQATKEAAKEAEAQEAAAANLAQVKAAREREDALFALYPHLNTTVNGRTVSETPMGIAIHAGVMYRHAMGTLNSNPNADTRYRATVAAENLAFAISTVWPDTHGQKAEIIDQWNEMTPGAPLADAVALWRLSRADDLITKWWTIGRKIPAGVPHYSIPRYRAAKERAYHAVGIVAPDLDIDAVMDAFTETGDPLAVVIESRRQKAMGGTQVDPLPAHAAVIMDALNHNWFDKTQPLGAIAVSAPPAPQADPQATKEAAKEAEAQEAAATFWAIATRDDAETARFDSSAYQGAKTTLINTIRNAYPDVDAEEIYQRFTDLGVHEWTIKELVQNLRDETANMARLEADAETEDRLYRLMPAYLADVTRTPVQVAEHLGGVYRRAVNAMAAHPDPDTRYTARVTEGDLTFALTVVWPDVDRPSLINMWDEMTPGTPLTSAVNAWRTGHAQELIDVYRTVSNNIPPTVAPYTVPWYRSAKERAYHAVGLIAGDLDLDTVMDAVMETGDTLTTVTTRIRADALPTVTMRVGPPVPAFPTPGDDPLPAHAATIMEALNHNLMTATPQVRPVSDPTATATYRAALGQAGYTFTVADVDTLADALIAAFGPTKDGVRRILATAIESAYPGTDGPAVIAQWLSMSGDIGDAVNVLTTQTP